MSHRASRVCAAAAAGLGVLSAASPCAAAPARGEAPPAPAAQSPLTAADTAGGDIRDIRGPRPGFPWRLALELLAAGAVVGAGGYVLWRRARDRAARTPECFEIALQRLEELRLLMRPASVREFSSAISDTVRRYIEAAFKVTATHQTTEEFLHGILKAENTPLALHRELLAEFLRQCDLAKFAGMSLSSANMESLYQSARSFIITTSPGRRPSAAAG